MRVVGKRSQVVDGSFWLEGRNQQSSRGGVVPVRMQLVLLTSTHDVMKTTSVAESKEGEHTSLSKVNA